MSTAIANSVVASSETSIEPSASRQRMLRHQGTCILLCTYFKLVTDAPDGFDIAVDGIGLYFLAQGADMHVDDMAVSIIIIAPDFIHQDFARIDPVGRSREQGQDIE